MRFQRYSDGSIRDGYRHSFGPVDFLALARFLDQSQVVPVREASNTAALVMRHDVDHNLGHALDFARWEARRGFRSSYFVLPSAWYWDEPETPSQLRAIAALGHEVGIHQDTVAEAYRRGFTSAVDGSALPVGNCDMAAQILASQIAQVRAWGIEVVGTSTHGSPLWREAGITNVFLWATGYTAADFGLEYADAYHLHRKALYISDNRGKFSSEPRREPGRQTHILIHPAHWDLEALAEGEAA